jgi:hypothetical protein
MGGYAHYQRDGLAGALAIHLFLYCAVGGCFAFGLYELLQPTRASNPGITAYKPPPKTVIAYGPASGFPPAPAATIPQPIARDDSPASKLETTGQATDALEPKATDAMARALPADITTRANKPKRDVKVILRREGAAQRERGTRVACIPRYDSSDAQTSSC